MQDNQRLSQELQHQISLHDQTKEQQELLQHKLEALQARFDVMLQVIMQNKEDLSTCMSTVFDMYW